MLFHGFIHTKIICCIFIINLDSILVLKEENENWRNTFFCPICQLTLHFWKKDLKNTKNVLVQSSSFLQSLFPYVKNDKMIVIRVMIS